MQLDLHYLLFLHTIFLDSPTRALQTLSRYPNRTDWEKNHQSYVQECRLSEAKINQIKELSSGNAIDTHLQKLHDKDIHTISLLDPDYPSLLKHIPDPPLLLFYKGNLALTKTPCFAVVGPRIPSDYGRKATLFLSKELATYFTIVSGLAAGIDTIAHQSAIDEMQKTIAVMGTSFDTVYPSENRALFDKIAETGLVISEYPLGTPSKGYLFSKRNRLITGLSKGVLVCEAGEKSGALVSARYAAEQNRDVFAIPNSIFSEQSIGVHRLIQDGAKLVNNVQDIISEYYDIQEKTPSPIIKTELSLENLTDPEQKIVIAFKENEVLGLDELSVRSGLMIHELLTNLTILEMNGHILAHPGQQFSKA